MHFNDVYFSIDIEDEFKSKIQYGRFIQQLQSSATKANINNDLVTSPSRIPVASGSRKSSLDSSPTRTPNNSSIINDYSLKRVSRESLGSAIDDEENERLLPSSEDRSSPSKSKIPLKCSRSISPPKINQHQQELLLLQSPNNKSQLPFSTLKESRLNNSNSSSGNSLNRLHSSSSQTSVSSTSTTSRSQRSGSATDSATEQLIQSEDKIETRSRKKQYEAFVMTGDRMICLAKTPANSEFLSKTTCKRTTGDVEKIPFNDDGDDFGTTATTSAKHSTPVVSTKVPDCQQSLDTEDVSGSGDTLLDSSTTLNASTTKDVSVKKSIQRKSSLKCQRQASLDSSPGGTRRNTQSPDLSTSSLISSEHYNGESLLDQDNLSPQSSSSPDTPEWSLIDSYHKHKSGEAKQPLLPIEASDDDNDEKQMLCNSSFNTNPEVSPEEAIISEGNRVIITIGTTTSTSSLISDDFSESIKPTTSMTSSSSITHPANASNFEDFSNGINNNNGMNNFPSLNSSVDSSEESDLESLRSFHPPPKAIDVPSALRLAKRLFHLEGFRRTDVSRHLGKNNDFSQVVAEEYLRYFDFNGSMSLDMALRCVFQKYTIQGVSYCFGFY